MWVFRGSALSALLFTVYLDAVLPDLQSLNDQMHLPRRYSIQPRGGWGGIHTQQFLISIARPDSMEAENNETLQDQQANGPAEKEEKHEKMK